MARLISAVLSFACLGLLFCTSNVWCSSIFAGAPCWVTNTNCVNWPHVAIGLSKVKYIDNPQLATVQAQNNAISNLAMTVKSVVKSSSNQRKLAHGKNTTKRWQHVSQERSIVQSSVSLQGVEFIDKWIDKRGTLYILVVVEQYSDINNSELPITSLDDRVYEVSDHNGQVIQSNRDYANQLTRSIRSEVEILIH